MSETLRKFALAAGLGLAALSATTAGAEPLRAAADPTIPPFAYRTVSGEVEGFNIDLGKAVAAQMGRDFELVIQEWSGIFAGLFAEHFDVIVAPVTITAERSKNMAFTEGYLETSLGFLTKAGAEMPDLEALKGKTVAVNNGAIADTWAQENAAKYGFEIQRYLNVPDTAQSVQSGRAFAALAETGAMAYLAQKQPGLKVPQTISLGGAFAFAIKPENVELRNQVDAAIECLKQDGTLAKLHEKWFGFPPVAGSPSITIVPGYGAPNVEKYDATEHDLKCN
jgi:polar amino acid transport system substrate-binding protein